eukprot:5485983-Alexandrium_andersonii.AAC.1
MSASLVGSEMCIRDSLLGLSFSDSPSRTLLDSPNNLGNREWASAGEKAVSYTHLTLPTICSV